MNRPRNPAALRAAIGDAQAQARTLDHASRLAREDLRRSEGTLLAALDAQDAQLQALRQLLEWYLESLTDLQALTAAAHAA